MMGKTHTVGGTLFLLAGVPLIAPILGMDISPAELAIAAVFVGPVAGLLPDIDTPGSMLSRGWVPFGRSFGFVSWIFSALLSIPARVVGATARLGTNHRGATHSAAFMFAWTIGALPLYMIFFALIAYILSLFTAIVGINFNPGVVWQWQREHFLSLLPATMLYVFLGYLSHLVFDSFNPSGVPWAWPRKKRYKDERGKWHSGYKSYHLVPPRFRIVTDSAAEKPFRWGCEILVVLLVLLNIALPIANRIDQGYGLRAAIVYSQAELEAGKANE